jgi:hypothetical protein
MKKLLTIALIGTTLFGFIDSDLDGVEDSLDKCPNTPFMDIVDLNGCTKKSLVSNTHYDIIVGLSYSAADYNVISRSDTLTTSIQADLYHNDWSLQFSASYYKAEGDSGYSDTGFYDTFIGGSYRIKPTKDLSIYLGVAALLPTYSTTLNNNNTDYKASASINYYIGDISLFGGYSYTIIEDDDVIEYFYQNTNSYNGGIGYYLNNSLYMSLSYFQGDSIYVDVEKIESVSLYSYYTLNKNWFTTINYSRGISESATDNYLSLRFGYYY